MGKAESWAQSSTVAQGTAHGPLDWVLMEDFCTIQTATPVGTRCICGRPIMSFSDGKIWNHCDPAWDQMHPPTSEKGKL